jgi:hypothetical protein
MFQAIVQLEKSVNKEGRNAYMAASGTSQPALRSSSFAFVLMQLAVCDHIERYERRKFSLADAGIEHSTFTNVAQNNRRFGKRPKLQSNLCDPTVVVSIECLESTPS